MSNLTKTDLESKIAEMAAALAASENARKEAEAKLATARPKRKNINDVCGEFLIDPKTPEEYRAMLEETSPKNVDSKYLWSIYETMMAVHRKYEAEKVEAA